jgi:hypothetical protein
MNLRIAVIADGGSVQRFALDSLDAIVGTDEITVFSCTNTRIRRRWLRHGAYYALNLLTVRNRLSRFVPIHSGGKKIARQVEFESLSDGGWQALPLYVIEELNRGGFDVILKFGMGLLRVPPHDALSVPILSYHHGDPDRFRGRPAGFWEIAADVPVMGQVVQIIGNQLDAGEVVAFAETKILPWSYRRTLIEAYRHSPLIINSAIRNAISGAYLQMNREGRNCRLPSNFAVFQSVGRIFARQLRRLFYGAFQEKAWRVSTADCPAGKAGQLVEDGFPDSSSWRTLPVAAGYRFYADPFFTNDPPAILVEALRARTGIGEIVQIDEAGHRPLIRELGHLSYPATARIAAGEIIVPESASWSEPRAYQGSKFVKALSVRGGERVSDPTLIEREGRIYLFGNSRTFGSNVLSLWSAASLEDEFVPHRASPIRISPEGSRMGGNIIEEGGRLFRLGQDFSGDYGDGLIFFEITELSEEAYSERVISRIHFSDRNGPHTLNVRGGQIVFDWYRNRFTPRAGLRRLKSVLQRRRPQATQ